jgi:hypothetical protein
LIVPHPRKRAIAPSKMSLTTIHNPEIRSQVLRITSLTCSGPARQQTNWPRMNISRTQTTIFLTQLPFSRTSQIKPYHHLRHPPFSISALSPLSLAFSFSSSIALHAASAASLRRTLTFATVLARSHDDFRFLRRPPGLVGQGKVERCGFRICRLLVRGIVLVWESCAI